MGNTARFVEISQRWRAVGITLSDFTGPRFEPQISCSRDKRITARTSGRFALIVKIKNRLMFINNCKHKLHVYIVKKNCPISRKKFWIYRLMFFVYNNQLQPLEVEQRSYDRQSGVAYFIGCSTFSRISTKISNLSKFNKLYK